MIGRINLGNIGSRLKNPAKAANDARTAGRQMVNSPKIKNTQAMAGRGLSTMRQNKVRTGMVVGAGMSVAAAIRSTGSGSAAPQQSLYRH